MCVCFFISFLFFSDFFFFSSFCKIRLFFFFFCFFAVCDLLIIAGMLGKSSCWGKKHQSLRRWKQITIKNDTTCWFGCFCFDLIWFSYLFSCLLVFFRRFSLQLFGLLGTRWMWLYWQKSQQWFFYKEKKKKENLYYEMQF